MLLNSLTNCIKFQKKIKINQYVLYKNIYYTFSSQKSSTSLNFYEILEVKPGASQKDIKTSYLKLAKIYHPDVYKGSDSERFKQIKDAYETLRKPAQRKKYDMQMKGDKEENQKPNYDDFKQEFDEHQQEKEAKRPGDFSFDGMKRDEKVDLNEEYKKFFDEPIKIYPEQVVTHQGVFERQLGLEERVRYEYAHMRNNQDLYTLKYAHQQGFQGSVDDTVEMMNNRNIPDSVIQAQEEKKYNKLHKWKWFALVGFFLVSGPFFISHTSRKKEIRDHLEKDSEAYLKLEEQKELLEIQQRFRFEQKHQEQQV